MNEIRQALNREVNWTISDSYRNYHQENGDKIVDIYTLGEIGAFGLPLDTINDVYNNLNQINDSIDKFLVISGIDTNGDLKNYSFQITTKFISQFCLSYMYLLAEIYELQSSKFNEAKIKCLNKMTELGL